MPRSVPELARHAANRSASHDGGGGQRAGAQTRAWLPLHPHLETTPDSVALNSAVCRCDPPERPKRLGNPKTRANNGLFVPNSHFRNRVAATPRTSGTKMWAVPRFWRRRGSHARSPGCSRVAVTHTLCCSINAPRWLSLHLTGWPEVGRNRASLCLCRSRTKYGRSRGNFGRRLCHIRPISGKIGFGRFWANFCPSPGQVWRNFMSKWAEAGRDLVDAGSPSPRSATPAEQRRVIDHAGGHFGSTQRGRRTPCAHRGTWGVEVVGPMSSPKAASRSQSQRQALGHGSEGLRVASHRVAAATAHATAAAPDTGAPHRRTRVHGFGAKARSHKVAASHDPCNARNPWGGRNTWGARNPWGTFRHQQLRVHCCRVHCARKSLCSTDILQLRILR